MREKWANDLTFQRALDIIKTYERNHEVHIMTVIRGATTIAADEPEEIRKAVKELLDQTVSRNGLQTSRKRSERRSKNFSIRR